jgi:hypothetical protein
MEFQGGFGCVFKQHGLLSNLWVNRLDEKEWFNRLDIGRRKCLFNQALANGKCLMD